MKRCVICGKEFSEYGNDPWPIKENGRCCDACNSEFVIGIRILQLSYPEKAKEIIAEFNQSREV